MNAQLTARSLERCRAHPLHRSNENPTLVMHIRTSAHQREEQACDSKPGFKISTITENLGQFDGKRVDLYILGSVDNCRFDGNTNRSPRIVKKE